MVKRYIEVEDDTPEEVHEKWSATLVRGETYFLRDLLFYHGTALVIAQHHKDHLTEHAVERVGTEDDETILKQRFAFTPYDGPLDVGMPVDGRHVNDQTRDAQQVLRLRAFNDAEEARIKAAKGKPVQDRIPEPRERVRPSAPPVHRGDVDQEYETAVVEEVTAAPRPRVRAR